MATGIPFDEQAKRRYLSALSKKYGQRGAAAKIGVSWLTVKRHLKEDPVFAQQVDDIEGALIEEIEGTLFDMALDENLGAIKMVLHNVAPDRWKDQQVLRHEHTGAGGGPIQIAQAHTVALRNVFSDPELRGAAINELADFPTHAELEAQIIDAEIVEDDDGG